MTHWPFIIAAYGLTFLGAITVTLWSYVAMRRAEAALETMERDK